MIRFALSTEVDPPAPIVPLTVSRSDAPSLRAVNVPALVDSGADFTVLPAGVVTELQLQQTGIRRMLGFGGRIVECPTYLVRIQVPGLPQRFLLAVPCDDGEPIALLGRDILSHYRITIDGPAGYLEIAP